MAHRHIYDRNICPDGENCERPKETLAGVSLNLPEGNLKAVYFHTIEPFPQVERRLKERYMRTLVESRISWPRGLKELAEIAGLSAPTVRAWCAEFDIKLPF